MVKTPRRLKVLVLDQMRGLWGSQRYLLGLAPLLRDRGIELVLAGPRSLELHDVWLAAGFEAIDLDLRIDRTIRSSGRLTVSGLAREGRNTMSVAPLICDLVRAGDYDAIWANAQWTHVDASIAGRVVKRPVVLHLHEEAATGVALWLRAGAVRLATRAVAVSHGAAAELPGFARKRVRVVPNGIDTRAMSPATRGEEEQVRRLRAGLGVGADDVMVLAASRLDPPKRVEDLIAAVGALDHPRVRLVIAGSTTAYPEYERAVKDEAKAVSDGSVRFCGYRDDMADWLRASDVLIHAGIREGMPLALLEAQSCGKPVIAYDVAGVPEAVVDGTTGLLVEPYDVAGLTNALRRLADDRSLRTKMGAAARTHILNHHRIEIQAERNAELLAGLCSPQGRTTA
jgi:glycosyltransferase involved in cell wall biosynthesis